MVRVRRAMSSLAQGDEVAPIQFRNGDFWKEFATDFNRVIERLGTSNTAAPLGQAEVDTYCHRDSQDATPAAIVQSRS